MYKFSLQENKKYFTRKLYQALTKYTLKFADLYTVTSNSDRKFLTDSFKLKKEVEIRRNCFKKEYKNFEKGMKTKYCQLEDWKNKKTLFI